MIDAVLAETPAARLIPGMASDDPAVVARTELELVKLCEAGDANAQRGCLYLIFACWRVGKLSFDDYAWRMSELFRIAVITSTIREVFVTQHEGAPFIWELEPGQMAEYVCILDMMADAGDPAGLVALGIVGDILPAETLDLGRRLRFLPPDRPCGVGAHDMFADLVPAAPPLTWEAVSSDLRPVTRRERLRCWLGGAGWRIRFEAAGVRWFLMRCWWRAHDWLEGFRHGLPE